MLRLLRPGDNEYVAGDIAISPRAVARARITAVLLLALGAAQPVIGASWFAVVGAVAAATLGVWLRTDEAAETKDAAVLVALMYGIGLVPGVGLWPVGPLIALLLTAGISWRAGRFSRWREWLRVGHIDKLAWLTVAAVAVVSIGGLLSWQRLFQGQLPDSYQQLAESVPWPAAVAGGLGFMILNGAIEDSIFFGVLLTPLLRYFPHRWAILLIALAFGTAHLHGVPNGLAGVVLAGAWAVMLAYLRTRTTGMLATYLAHVVADTTIIAMLLPPLLLST